MGISELNSCYKGLFTYYVSQILAFLDPPRRQQPSSFATPLLPPETFLAILVWSGLTVLIVASILKLQVGWTGQDWTGWMGPT